MELIIVYGILIWIGSIIANLCFIRILDDTKLNFSDLVNRELPVLLIMCILAPAAFVILMLGISVKIGIRIANSIPMESKGAVKKDCSNCDHRCSNECLFFKMTLRPKMLCKGRFFCNNEAQYKSNDLINKSQIAQSR